MKLTIGSEREVYGTVEDLPSGKLKLGSTTTGGMADPRLRRLLQSVLGGERPSNHPYGMPGFMLWLTGQLNGTYTWCQPTTEADAQALLAEAARERADHAERATKAKHL